MKKLNTLIFIFFAITSSLWAKDIYVSSAGDDDLNDGVTPETSFKTFNKAYSLAESGDIIYINGTVDFTASLAIAKSITVQGINNGTLDAGGVTKFFNVSLSEEDEMPYFKLIDLTLRNGNGEYNTEGSYNIGGAVTFAGSASPVIEVINCTFDQNTTANNGGAVAVDGGMVSFDGCTFTNNSTTGPAEDSNMGGAMALSQDAQVVIKNSRFVSNTSSYDGGAIFFNSNNGEIKLTISQSYFASNTAVNNGGAIGVIANKKNPSSVKIINSTLYNNSADNNGGAVSIASTGTGSLELINATVYGNITTNSFGQAGGLRVNNVNYITNLYNTILFENVYSSGETIVESDLQVTSPVNVYTSIIGAADKSEVETEGLFTIDELSLVGKNNSGNNIIDKAELTLTLDAEKEVMTFSGDAVAVGLGKGEYLQDEPNDFVFDQLGNIRPNTNGMIDAGAYQMDAQEVTDPVSPIITASNVTGTTADLSWTAANAFVSKYEIYVDEELIDETTSLTYQLTSLDEYTSYDVKVIAYDVFGKSSQGTSNIMTLDETLPSFTPALTSSAITETGFTVTWSAATDDESGLKGYILSIDDEEMEIGAEVTSYDFSELTTNTEYAIAIKAVDNADNATDFSSIDVTTTDETAPTAPTSLSASEVQSYSAVIKWTASTDNDVVDHYILKVGDAEFNTMTAVTEYTLEELTHSTDYTVTIVAVDAVGNVSEESEELSFQTIIPIPTVPEDLTIVADKTTAEISWSASTHIMDVTYVVDIDGEEVETSETSLSLTELTENTEYTVKVKAVDTNDVSSEFSESVSFTTLYSAPTTPADVAVSNVSYTTASVSWTASTHILDVTYTVTVGEMEYTTAETSLDLTGLAQGTEYDVTVQAVDENDIVSETSASVAFTTMIDYPSTPANITVSEVNETSVTITWDAITHSSDFDYVLTFGETEMTVEGTSYTVTDLDENTSYDFTLHVEDEYNFKSEVSEVQSVLTTYFAPVSPSEIKVTEITVNSATISWTAPLHAFEISYVITMGEQEYETSATSFTFEELTEATDYSFTIKTVNEKEEASENSDAVTFSTLSAEPLSLVDDLSALVKAFPNPSVSKMTIQLPSHLQGTYYVSDLNGRKVEVGNLDTNQFNLSLPSGMYILNIITNEKAIVKKISFQ
ncbi:fibronectin type III domain-containing protein [Flammeovirga agarivorans]|uniref:T9SS type A sorting domain-containing protein n=1 Tax=Flammeovirga agarivorans TaxID=2726742 RepID=A0A7X8XYN4_9BACT|nr:fibronectin type III domain-containing protein [Flammeovirga agarivorans]NLR94382.1 T9SS type A sorting domain-containing protein [Flammeovirga agarivorans]